MKDLIIKASIDKFQHPIHKIIFVFTKDTCKDWVFKHLPKKYKESDTINWHINGCCFTYYDKIYVVCPYIHKKIRFGTLIHEIHHAVSYLVQFNYPKNFDLEETESYYIGYISSMIIDKLIKLDFKFDYYSTNEIKIKTK